MGCLLQRAFSPLIGALNQPTCTSITTWKHPILVSQARRLSALCRLETPGLAVLLFIGGQTGITCRLTVLEWMFRKAVAVPIPLSPGVVH